MFICHTIHNHVYKKEMNIYINDLEFQGYQGIKKIVYIRLRLKYIFHTGKNA